MKYQIEVASENALILYFGQEPGLKTSLEISTKIQQVRMELQGLIGTYLVELIPSYASLLVIFDPFVTDHFAVKKMLNINLANLKSTSQFESQVIEIPIYYGEDVGLDLHRIATNAGLSTEEVIALHLEPEYRVFAIGFAPGFGYLGEVDERIAAPRLTTPRASVPKGAVGIADQQTAIYPAQSPGGWNIIGRCPIAMFSPQQHPSMPFDIGDKVKFKAVDKNEFFALGGTL